MAASALLAERLTPKEAPHPHYPASMKSLARAKMILDCCRFLDMSANEGMTSIADLLLHDPILAKCNHQSLARLLPYIEERCYVAGEYIYHDGEPANGLYLLVSGEVRLQTHDGEMLDCGYDGACLGEECATDSSIYLTGAVAVTPLTALYIPRDSLSSLLAANPTLKNELMFSLMSHMTGKRLQVRMPVITAKKKPHSNFRVACWVANIILPLAVLLMGAKYGMDRNVSMFLAIFSATVMMWIFSLVDEYIPALFAIMAILITGIAPPMVVLAGFSSDSFLMAMSILGLSAVIVTSGLSYRAMLWLLRHLPNSRFWHNFGLAMTGFFLTPLIPSANGRASLIIPFYEDIMQSLRFSYQREAATQLMVSAFAGISLFSAMFFSSKAVNFVVFGLLPVQVQDHFNSSRWLIASGVAALVLLAAYAASAAWMFRSGEKPQLSKDRVDSQLELMGHMKRRVWAALLGILALILGLLTTSLHRISPPWVGLTILCGLLLFGSLNKKEFMEKVSWSFFIYLSGLFGMASSFSYLKMDNMLAALLPGMGAYMHDNFGMFVLILFGVISVVRLVVPTNAIIVILASLFIPLADAYGVNPWVIGFTILALGETWFLPYQCTYYQQLQEVNRTNPLYQEKTFLLHNGLMNFVRLAAIYASIPYWKAIGLL